MSHDVWHTPPDLYRVLDAEFHFDMDAACTEANCLCPFGITEEQNALATAWLPADAAKVMRDNIWQLIGVESAFGFEQQKNAELTARLHALTGYVQHKPDCDQWMGDTFCGVTFSQPQLNPKRACTCGLADLLTPASAEEPEKA